MSGAPRAAVVVPVRNGQDTIADCLDSILRVDYPSEEVEVVAVDNASTDDTAAILARYEPRVRIVREPRIGPSPARNAGIWQTRAGVIAFTDADCTVAPEWLTALVSRLDDESVGLVGGAILSRRPFNYVESFGERIHDHARAITEQEPPYVIGMNCAARRSTLEAVAGFDEGFPRSQDVELSYRVLAAGYRLVYEAGAVVYHRNESTLPGLFREGFTHGYWSVPTLRRHSRLVGGRTRPRGRGQWLRTVSSALREPANLEARCTAAFATGKKLGKLVGSARFRYLEL